MRKGPLVKRFLGIDWTKWFFPSLVAKTAYRYIFRHRERNVKFDPVKAQKLTSAFSLAYVLFASTAAGMGKVLLSLWVPVYHKSPLQGLNAACTRWAI